MVLQGLKMPFVNLGDDTVEESGWKFDTHGGLSTDKILFYWFSFIYFIPRTYIFINEKQQ